MIKSLFARLPQWAKNPLRRLRVLWRDLAYSGDQRWCPICERGSNRFRAFGLPPRPDAECMHCGGLERHRLVWLYLHQLTDLFDGRAKRMLHVAAESWFEPMLRAALGSSYITADLSKPQAMVKMDITDIQFPDNHFDVIYCSHVLEHVPDDRKAMREFCRVLKPDGWAILLVPIYGAVKTYEDSSITSPEERSLEYGQFDHLRRYGTDYVDRLREAGFDVRVDCAPEMFPRAELIRMGLTQGCGEIYYCTKRSERPTA